MRSFSLAVAGLLAATGAFHCGSDAETPGDPGGSSGGVTPEGGATDSATSPPPDKPLTCSSAQAVETIRACIDDGRTPRACLAEATAAGAAACDIDKDGLDDALEDAMLRAYAPVFAFNKGERGHTEGDSESSFPTNLDHYVSHSTLYWRVDGDDGTKKVVDPKPTLGKLPSATFDDNGKTRRANVPALGEGPNFWLCLNHSPLTSVA